MAVPLRRLERVALRGLDVADHLLNRAYGWRGNPLYHSGAVAVSLLLVLIVTGLWLLVFYRVGSPYASVSAIAGDPLVGRWVRALHRFSSDAVLVATGIHALRMLAQGRSWGQRALAWTSGVVAVGLLYLCGLTGFVMVWDAFGYQVAREGARLLDSLPILSEPISRAFAGDEALLGPFFFLNLFAHIALPLGIALVLWLHVSRVARPVLLPPRGLIVATIGALLVAAIAWPVPMQPEADPFTVPRSVVVSLFYGFWLPLVRPVPAGAALALVAGIGLALVFVPRLTERRGTAAPPPSTVDESVCTGCTQCALDCPFDAITMVAREPGGRSLEVARVDPARCVSCGICAGSCAPMAVGPPGRTGRDQLALVRQRVAGGDVAVGAIVVLRCARVARGWASQLTQEGAVVCPVDCAGSVHTSVIESLVRAGAAGVLVMPCPPRDCWNREGATWLVERMYGGREAELKGRVDGRRVAVANASAADGRGALAALRSLRARVAPLDAAPANGLVESDDLCDVLPAEEAT